MSERSRDRLQTHGKHARGMGTARSGVHHWVHERITAALAVPLCFWLVWSVVRMPGWSFESFRAWQAAPLNAILMLFCVITIFYHAALGMQVILEDYVHSEAGKFFSLAASNTLFFASGIACVFCIARMALGH